MATALTLFLWLVWCWLVVTVVAGVGLAVFIAYDLYKVRRSPFTRWDQEMRDFQAARRVTSPEVK